MDRFHGRWDRWLVVSGALSVALLACGPASETATKPRVAPPGWSDSTRPVYGLGCQLPDGWSLNVGDSAAVASPPPPDEDAFVLFVKTTAADARPPHEVIAKYLPLRDSKYAARGVPLRGLASATASEATATLEDTSVPVQLRTYRVATASGDVVVALVRKTASTPPESDNLAGIAASLRVVEPPKTAEEKVPRDLAGRPLKSAQPANAEKENGS